MSAFSSLSFEELFAGSDLPTERPERAEACAHVSKMRRDVLGQVELENDVARVGMQGSRLHNLPRLHAF